MSAAPPKRYLLYCESSKSGEKPEEELIEGYGSFLKAAIAINEMAETAINLEPKKWANRSDYFRDRKIRVYDTLTNKNIRILE